MTPSQFENYKVNIPTVDNAHLIMFTLIDLIKEDCNNKTDSPTKIKALLEEFQRHCLEEELFFVKIKYPQLEFHRLDHMRLIDKIRSLEHSEHLIHKISILDEFKMRLANHSEKYDRQVSEFIRLKPKSKKKT